MKNRTTHPLILLLAVGLLLASGAGLAAERSGLPTYTTRPEHKWLRTNEHPVFQDVEVHDPSVIRAKGAWYIFGSHLAEARTTDLLQWESLADGVNSLNPLFVDVTKELTDIFAWSSAYDLWANDVIQLADGRFYMYPNLSRGDSPRASLGLAVADDVEGPYTYEGIFLQSGMWNEISDDGVNIYDPTVHPNTIDPDTFFDNEGTLWMSYGSYSGGIFILKMDPDTGLPLPNQGYGKHLMGGNHACIEGSNVLYSPDSGYYYMFVSFGGLAANGGYNIRVSRSRQPDGPYYDGLGIDMATVKAAPNMPICDVESIQPYAQKLMGNFEFEQQASEPGAGGGIGYVSPGHNTSFYEPETGQYFLIFHTRFPGQGDYFEVRVHEMFINEDGWPVVAPHRYVPHPQGPYPEPLAGGLGKTAAYRTLCMKKPDCWDGQAFRRGSVPGEYKFIDHGKEITAEIKTSTLVMLGADGTVSGDASGHWYRSFGNRITIDLDGSGVFNGVFSWGWNEISEQFVVTFTAQSEEGISIWGSKLAE